MHAAKILADSLSPDGVRLTTMELRYPRIIHAEMMTHRQFSRNAASSRAIPVAKMIQSVVEDPYIPSEWGANQKGMQAGEPLSKHLQNLAETEWLVARDKAVEQAQVLSGIGLHKQLTNRLLEPFLWYTCLVTATEWSNFFNLRCHPDAHPDIRIVAELMRDAMEASTPALLGDGAGDWHLPLIREEDWDWSETAHLSGEENMLRLVKISVGRCARVSYLTHDGKRDQEADIVLHDRLKESGHLSPFEHVARIARTSDWKMSRADWGEMKWDNGTGWLRPEPTNMWFGNLRGFVQYRKLIPNESDMLGAR